MMGHYYETFDGTKCEFLGAVDLYTVGSKTRMIDNYAYEVDNAGEKIMVVGFENHSGKTYLGAGVSPLGKVLAGNGNNGEDGTEGSCTLEPLPDDFENLAHDSVLEKVLNHTIA